MLDNLNTKIWCRLADDRTAAEATEGLGLCTVRLPDTGVGLSYGGVGGLSGSSHRRLAAKDVPLIRPSWLTALPRGEAFVRMKGEVWKLRVPLLTPVPAQHARPWASRRSGRPSIRRNRRMGTRDALHDLVLVAHHARRRGACQDVPMPARPARRQRRVSRRSQTLPPLVTPPGLRSPSPPSVGASMWRNASARDPGQGCRHSASVPAFREYWQAGTSRRSSMGIEEDGGIGALLPLVCDVWMRWPLSLRAPVGEVQRAAVCVGVARDGPQDHAHPTLTTKGLPRVLSEGQGLDCTMVVTRWCVQHVGSMSMCGQRTVRARWGLHGDLHDAWPSYRPKYAAVIASRLWPSSPLIHTRAS